MYSESGQYSSDKIEKLNALYQSLSEQYTRSSAVKVRKGGSVPVVKYIFYTLPLYRELSVTHFDLSDNFWVLIYEIGLLILIYSIFSHFQRMPLDFLQDKRFKEAVAKYIKPLLTKVSFRSVKSLGLQYNALIVYVSYILMLVSGCSFIVF